jgi:two-component system response regulator HydG
MFSLSHCLLYASARKTLHPWLNIFARKENKAITGVADHVIQSMLNYNWPGNIRELENLMARCVLLTNGPIIDSLKLPVQAGVASVVQKVPIRTMTENERDHILMTLERCNCKTHGEGGAAELLGLHPSRLNSRMKKLGVGEKYLKNEND